MPAPLILLVGALAFQSAVPAQTGKVTGQVVDAVTGDPVRKASVVIVLRSRAQAAGGIGGGRYAGQPAGPANVLATDGSGRFQATDLAPGTYSAQAQRNGYVDKTAAMVTFTLAAGDHPTLTLKLIPQGVIAGRVLDEDWDPLAHVQVQTLRWMSLPGRPRGLVPSGYGSTNDLGEFRIFGLAPGKYLVSAQAQRQGPLGPQASPGRAYAEVFFPGVMAVAEAQPLEVTPGMIRLGVDLRLRKVTVVNVSGRVGPLSDSGEPAAPGSIPDRRSGSNVHVILQPNSGGTAQPHHAQANAQGEFQFVGIPSGSYTLTANVQRSPQERRAARMPVEVGDRDVSQLALTLEPLATLRGRIRCEDPVAYAGIGFILEPAVIGQAGGMGRADALGEFEIFHVEKLRYRPRLVGLPKGYYVKSIQLGTIDATEMLDATAGLAGEVTVTLAKGTAELSGQVTKQGQPAAGEVVLLLNGRQEVMRSATADAQGRYAFEELAPGDYRVSPALGIDLTDAETITQLFGRALKVTLSPQGRETRQLELP